jgi:ribosomal protein S18 acetylase RimI-like enzyme
MTAAGLTIREARPDELPSVIELDAKVTGVKRPDFWLDLSHQRAGSKTLAIVVAAMGDEIIGYALGDLRAWPVRAPACGWIYAIGVAAEYRQQKVASALMEAMIDHFAKNGAASIRTMIEVDDHLLMSFLRSFGMTAGPFVELELKLERP